MEGKKGTRRERWLERTEAAYRRMFEGQGEELVTLTERLGLPIRSAPIESTIRQINRRVKGVRSSGWEAVLKRSCNCGRRN